MDIAVISAATVMVIAPLLIGFVLFQRQFVQAFLRAGIKQPPQTGRYRPSPGGTAGPPTNQSRALR